MNETTPLTDGRLQELQQNCRETLSALVESLEARRDMQGAIRQMMSLDDMLETFSQLAVNDPDLMRVTLQASVAALVNLQSLQSLEMEIHRRSELN